MPIADKQKLTPESIEIGTKHLAAVDRDLERLFQRLGTPPLWPREPGFATLIHIILEQQVSVKAARTMFQRLHRHLGQVTPDAMVNSGEGGLKSVGLTRQKTRYCLELANRVLNGQLDLGQLENLNNDEGRNALLAVPGLGAWSVDVYYLMALRRPDVWPYGDLALASALQDVKGLSAPATRDEQKRFASSWSPWRAVAARMLWMHYLDARGQGQ